MQPKVFGLVNPQGVIENAFYWDEVGTYPTQEGYSIVRIDNVENCGIGWTYINGEFAEPVEADADRVVQPISNGAQDL